MSEEILLGNLTIGDQVKLLGFRESNREYRMKLLALGLTPDITMTLTKMAPLGDPVEILVRGSAILLRKSEANILILEKLEGSDEACTCR